VTQTIRTTGDDPYDVEFDNFARLTRTVTFAVSDRCQERFRIVFDVRRGAYLRGRTSHPNEIPVEERGRVEDSGTLHVFEFSPQPDGEFTSWVDIYDGFGERRRNIHFHIDTYQSHIRRLIYELDLSQYRVEGCQILQDPQCRYSPVNAPTCKFCNDLRMQDPLPIGARPRDGVYVWELAEIEGGVVDILWDVDRNVVSPGGKRDDR
jgi:hypothetical protein